MDLQIQLARFIATHARELHWLQQDAQDLWTTEDLQGELYLALAEQTAETGCIPDLADPDAAAGLLRQLHRKANALGRPFRNASRLDHAPPDQTPLIERLVADEGQHPLSLMEDAETPVVEFDVPPPEHSQLAAWHHLLERFERKMRRVADYLLISSSWCGRCRRRVRGQAVVQWPLPQPAQPAQREAVRPWRRFKLPPRPRRDARQLQLDYWKRPPQPETGQLWLL